MKQLCNYFVTIIPGGSDRKQKFYTALPEEFSRKDYLESAESLNIPDKTAQNYIAALLTEDKIERVKHDLYIKKK